MRKVYLKIRLEELHDNKVTMEEEITVQYLGEFKEALEKVGRFRKEIHDSNVFWRQRLHLDPL